MNDTNKIFDEKYQSKGIKTSVPTPTEYKDKPLSRDFKIDTSKYKVNKPTRQIIRIKISHD
jgi:hypothetical protein